MPVSIQTLKLSNIQIGQNLDGWLLGNSCYWREGFCYKCCLEASRQCQIWPLLVVVECWRPYQAECLKGVRPTPVEKKERLLLTLKSTQYVAVSTKNERVSEEPETNTSRSDSCEKIHNFWNQVFPRILFFSRKLSEVATTVVAFAMKVKIMRTNNPECEIKRLLHSLNFIHFFLKEGEKTFLENAKNRRKSQFGAYTTNIYLSVLTTVTCY